MKESQQVDLDGLAEEFSELIAAGQAPTVESFAERNPDFAEEIRELFPTLQFLNVALSDEKSSPGAANAPELKDKTIADFRLIRELGRGGMGVVYEAEQLSLGRKVALKVLPPTLLGSSRKARFAQEARAAGRLHHTNIVPVFDVGSADEITYLTMQLIPGMSLDKLIAKLRKSKRLDSLFRHCEPTAQAVEPQPADSAETDWCDTLEMTEVDEADLVIGPEYWRNVATIGRQVAEALHYAHEQGVLHRDIKPGNLIIDSDHRIWVSDFGLAKIVDSEELTKTGDVIGTIKYMAPERIWGDCNARSDIYSLGTTLYELASLKPAFDLRTKNLLFNKKGLREGPKTLKNLRPSIPRDLQTIIEKAMAHEPENRYEDAEQLAADLTRFLNDEPIRARVTTFVEATVRWARRNPLLASTLGALAASLLAVAVISMRSAQHFRQLNTELTKTNESLAVATSKATAAQSLSRQRETRLLFKRGREFAEQGKIAEGLLLMANALQICPGEMQDYENVIRTNISSWSALVPEILEFNPDPFVRHRSIDYRQTEDLGESFLFADTKIFRTEAKTGEQVGYSYDLDSYAFDCALSPQGNFAAVITRKRQNQLLVFDLDKSNQTPKQLSAPEGTDLERIYWHPNGKSVTVRTKNNESFFIWMDFRSPEYSIHKVKDGMDEEMLEFLSQCMVEGDKSQVLNPQELRQTRDGRFEFVNEHSTTRIIERFSDNQFRFALPHPQELWTTLDGEQIQCSHYRIRSFRSPSRFPPSSSASLLHAGASKYWNQYTASFSANGKVAITRDANILFWDQPDRKVPRSAARLWNTETGMPLGKPLQHPFDSVRVADVSPDGAIAATGGYEFGQSSGAVYIWDGESGERRFGPLFHEDYLSAIDFSPDGKFVAAGDYAGQVRIWDTSTGTEVGETIVVKGIVFALKFDPSGERVAIGTFGEFLSENNLSVWKLSDRDAYEFSMPHKAAVNEIEWLPGENKLVVFNDNVLKLWDLDHPQKPIATLNDTEMIFCAKPNRQGDQVAIGTSLGSIYLLNTTNGEVNPNVLSQTSSVYDVDFSPDGTRLAAACNDGGLRIWDLQTYEQMGPPLMQNRTLYRAKFLPAGKRVLSTCIDGMTRIWNVPQAKDLPVKQLQQLVEVRTKKRFVDGVALNVPGDDWGKLRERAIEEKVMLNQTDSALESEGMPNLVQVISRRELHDARARDAEQDGDWFGAHWHLNRIIEHESGQNNWQLLVRRARTWSERNDFDRAMEDYTLARSVLTGESTKLTNWFRHRVVECQRSENWQTAVWYLDQLLMIDATDGDSYASRADAHKRLGKMKEYESDLKLSLKYSKDPWYLRAYAK